ncbi:MAG: hypothetical protein UX04_C0005G0002 [Microgenomates group bacterium GW2011_GWF2_45_18]|nr:MAG: hypothetical protein UW18_C0007G0002 [Microgenomates group bacterium GW2011_GWF1_44_10]KKU01583.1 MAG: hypothetical protein UX04_C0005G0002 [Microgenomates group bacterium GW2011_GWF2_45_18]OGJ41327.1 MAG: hypothetical protein A2378_03555 [Candidatus Pacebacteria bacterium RIFOXYB1_FULL_44_10]HAX01621.1 hypothetical protein [Candidatus Paceibacterota bacterium]
MSRYSSSSKTVKAFSLGKSVVVVLPKSTRVKVGDEFILDTRQNEIVLKKKTNLEDSLQQLRALAGSVAVDREYSIEEINQIIREQDDEEAFELYPWLKTDKKQKKDS